MKYVHIKIIGLIILILVLACNFSFAANSSGYKDVPDNQWYTNDVIFSKNKGFITGYNSTTFGTNDKLTRVQLVTILWRMAGKQTVKDYNYFKDVDENEYYGQALKWATYYGIIKGYNRYQFGTNDPITRQDFAVILNRLAKAEEFSGDYVSKFKDPDKVADYAKTALKWANNNGIITGKGGTHIDPIANTTRVEATAMIVRYYKKYFPGGNNLMNLTLSEQNAFKSARSYTSHMAFSKQSLIHQLEFEKYPENDAILAANNLGIDWKEQAVKKAKSYLDSMPFSKEGLRKQLKFEKYTDEEVNYAINNIVVDWKEEAVKKGKSYLDSFSFSKEELKHQLEFEEFTSEEASYATKKLGF